MTNTVTLPEKLCQTINFSMMSGMPVLVTYWDETGQPQTSWRGSTHVHSDGRLAIWIRSKQGGLPQALTANPQMRLAYRNPHSKSFVLFDGQGQLEHSEAGSRAIYDGSPPMEQKSDPERKGIGLIISVNRVSGTLDGETISITS